MITDVFCKILNKEIPAEVVAEEEDWLAVKDINPKAPVHVLILPKKHLTDLVSADQEDEQLLGRLLLAVKTVAQKLNLEKGFRVIVNHGADGGQLVPHLHLHLLGGKRLGPKLVN